MSALQAHLSEDLDQAVLGGALSVTEAWALQDEFLLAESDLVEVPEILEPQVRKLVFWQVPAANLLPL